MASNHQIPLVSRYLRSSRVDLEAQMRDGLFKQFLSNTISELEDRFGPHFRKAAQCFAIIPFYMISRPCEIIQDSSLFQLYLDDVESWTIVKSEIMLWQNKWKQVDLADLPKTALDALNYASVESYPNISILLQISSTLPVTTSSSERSFSQLRGLKTYLRNSTAETRLNGLALLLMHREVEVPTQKVIQEFMRKKARRLNVAL